MVVPRFTTRDIFEEQVTLTDPNQSLLEIQNSTLSRIWDPFVKALPNFTKLKLPKNLEQTDNIPMNDLILKLRGLRRVKVEDTSWPLWAYILINLGVSMVITGLLFWYFNITKRVNILSIVYPYAYIQPLAIDKGTIG